MAEKKRLLYISETMVSGVLSCVSGLANALSEDFDITVAYGLRPDTPADLRELFDPSIRLIPVKSFTRSISPAKDWAAFWELKAIAKQVRPDVIHLHSSKAGVLGRLAFPGNKIPVFYTPHGYSFLMSDCSRLKRALYFSIESLCARGSCTTVSCSPGEHRETLRLTKRACYVNNAVNTEELSRFAAQAVLRPHPFTVFMLGRICTPRNPSGFNTIAQALPDVHFLWIGDGELRSELTAPNIEVTGWVDRGTAVSLAMNADAFLLPSLWEGMPMSLLEAMYLRRPCIVSNVIGSRDVIRNGVNGYLCEDLSDYTGAIADIRAGNAGQLVEQAYADILTGYNTRVQAAAYRKIYAGLGRMGEDGAQCL